MNKMLLTVLCTISLLPAAMAGNIVNVRVSFTIPNHIETKPCEKAQAAAPAQTEQTTPAPTTNNMTIEQKVVRNNVVCIMQTVLPK